MKVLIVEDETLVALIIEEMLEDLGHEVVGPVATVEEGLRLVEHCDAAVLDVNLGSGVTAFPVADALLMRGVPFAFSTGYSQQSLEDDYGDVPKLQKPYNADGLRKILSSLEKP